MLKMHGSSPCTLLLALMTVCAPTASVAHEYWIAPKSYVVDPGERVEARLLVGQMMQGAELPWLSHQARSFTIAAPEGARDESGMDGDLPALSFIPEEPGLHVIALEIEPVSFRFQMRHYRRRTHLALRRRCII